MNEEIWKDVMGYEGFYQVSNLGRVKNTKSGQILKPLNTKGYGSLTLCKEGVRKQLYIHRLVAIAFIPNPNNYPLINHKDEITNNNAVGNLEWCTQKYNMNYGTIIGRLQNMFGKPVVQKTKCGEVVRKYKSAKEAERETGIFNTNISQCVLGRSKTAGGFIWERGESV